MNIDTNLPIDGSFAPNYRFDADNGFDDQSSLSTSLVVPAPVSAREETARRNGLLNDAARDIHKRLSNSKRERAASLRQAAQRTAQESRRNNEAYQNLKKTRIADNRKIRKEIHRKRRMGTKASR